MTCKTIAVVNQKGGVGKTTTTVNLAACLAVMKRRVLLVDLDAQGNATMGVGVEKNAEHATVRDVLLGEATAAEAIQALEGLKLSLLPANGDATEADVKLRDRPRGDHALRDALAKVKDDYDFVLLDCPPSLSKLTVNALVAAESVLIPMQCEYYALEGLAALTDTVARIRASLNPALKLEGVLRTMFDPRSNLANDVSAQLATHYGEVLYRTAIPRNVRLAEAPSHGLPVLAYDPSSTGAKAYLALAGEVLRRQEGGSGEVAPAAALAPVAAPKIPVLKAQ